jgi:uncharacterized protein (DUF2141 family)
MMHVRTLLIGSSMVLLALAVCATAQTHAAGSLPNYTLTVVVHGVNDQDGNIGVLVFNSEKGWAEDRTAALKDVVVPAHPGTVTVTIPDLPAGDYGVAICHDVNKNHKLDKNFLGMPKEQWGLSNDPHATIKAPPFSKSRFTLKSNQQIQIQMQGPK